MKFRDLPIEGEVIYGGTEEVEQWPEHEFTEAMEHLFSFDQIEAVRWRQFTPYFNDGTPCIFRVYEPYFRFKDEAPSASWWEENFVPVFSDLFKQYGGWVERWENQQPVLNYDDVETQEFAMALREAQRQISTHHASLLRQTFGDHADVTVYRDRINIDFVTHE